MKYSLLLLWITLPLWSCSQTSPVATTDQVMNGPIELGKVQWLRDYEQALEQSRETGKPVFILFQEVPGCATCRTYGREVLSHPLLVEAIESLFVPLAIYNNKEGADRAVLKRYGEPAWNNPVVRLVDSFGDGLVPRISGDYSPVAVATSMIYALQRADRDVPLYLQLMRDEWQARQSGTEKVTPSMYCFWTGEKTYGSLTGVIGTTAGFVDGREVVEVEYDPSVISLEALLAAGRKGSCADRVYAHNDSQIKPATRVVGEGYVNNAKTIRPDRRPKYYLSRTHYRAVPMTGLQAARANALIGEGKSPDAVLSPRQVAQAEQLAGLPASQWENRIGKPIY